MAIKPRSPKSEPVISGALASVAAALLAHYGLALDAEAITTTVTTVVVIVTFLVRRVVSPVKP